MKMVIRMGCKGCCDCKIYEEDKFYFTKKTYVCYIDGHIAKSTDILEETCPYLELLDMYF